MAELICTGIVSLDGYIADEDGVFDWSAPDEEVHAFVNDLVRPIGTHLYGRRLYEVMLYWETFDRPEESGRPGQPDHPDVELDYARVWRSADKIVYSTTLQAPSSARTRIERSFDPDAVRALKATADRDLAIGGAELAGHAFRAGLVDEVDLFMSPVVVGGGTRFWPDGVRFGLSLVQQRRFGNGVVYLRYRVTH
jgi:dihydrofolate reductase